jgi:hypothetical protein
MAPGRTWSCGEDPGDPIPHLRYLQHKSVRIGKVELEAVRKGLRIRMGRSPAEIAEGAEVYWEGGKGTYIGTVFNNCLGQLNRYH